MSITRADERLSQLSQTLWRQRARVEMLLYRLEVQQMVLALRDDHADYFQNSVDAYSRKVGGIQPIDKTAWGLNRCQLHKLYFK